MHSRIETFLDFLGLVTCSSHFSKILNLQIYFVIFLLSFCLKELQIVVFCYIYPHFFCPFWFGSDAMNELFLLLLFCLSNVILQCVFGYPPMYIALLFINIFDIKTWLLKICPVHFPDKAILSQQWKLEGHKKKTKSPKKILSLPEYR